MTLPDPGARAGCDDVFPCGCRAEADSGHIHPCQAHEMQTDEAKLWELLKLTFPEMEDDGFGDVPSQRIPETPFDEMSVENGGDEPEQRIT